MIMGIASRKIDHGFIRDTAIQINWFLFEN